jgi:hypothetical protein
VASSLIFFQLTGADKANIIGDMSKKRAFFYMAVALLAFFFYHRLTMDIRFFNITPGFERPQAVTIPDGLDSIRAEDCGVCHTEEYAEWKSSIHANAWKDPYFRSDFEYDGSQQICLNCHTPLVNQQENLVTGFRDKTKFNPLLEPNPDFDPAFKDEGVTCAVCHLGSDGIITGPGGIKNDVHPVKKDETFSDGRSVCRRCHEVFTNRWDTFLKMPLCGTFVEAEKSGGKVDCQNCHMPKTTRPIVPGGESRTTGRHLWRGGHDKDTVINALDIKLTQTDSPDKRRRRFELSLTNRGAKHRLPTGTPDRHLEISFRLLSESGEVLKEKIDTLERVILWRPFMVDIYDSRLEYMKEKMFDFEFKPEKYKEAVNSIEAEVRYGLLHEKRRKRIGYENSEPISYRVFYEKVLLE